MIENKSAPTIEEIYNKYDNDKEWSNKYSPFKKNNIFCAHEKERALLSMLNQYGFAECIHEKKILEIGAGTGNNCLQMISYGYIPENIYCNELQNNRLDIAKTRLPSSVKFLQGDALNIDAALHNSFDIILISTVFSSILNDNLKKALAKKALALLSPNGVILWYDFTYNNPQNPNVRGVSFKEIKDLFGTSCTYKKKKVTLAPPISRRLSKLGFFILHLFNWRILRTHILVSIRKIPNV